MSGHGISLPLIAPRRDQAAFGLVSPGLRLALVIGVAGGFTLAATLTTTLALGVAGPWWAAMAQAHGHAQLYGWAGLFVIGVALHFVPRLRGNPLALRWAVPWVFGLQGASIVARMIAQPLMAVSTNSVWRALTLLSGALELVALTGAVAALGTTLLTGPRMRDRSALWSVAPLLVGALVALLLSAVVNLVNMVTLASSTVFSLVGFVPARADMLNVDLGLFGFLVPVALAMSARTLPMYAGLDPFPTRLLWPLAGAWWAGLAVYVTATLTGSGVALGIGEGLMGAALVVFIGGFIRALIARGRLPQRVAQLAPKPETRQHEYRTHVRQERGAYGPFVAIVGSSYTWALLGGALLLVDGAAQALGGSALFAADAIRHSLALGFIALLICGIAPRMVPGFSGKPIRSAGLVWATLWLGDSAAVLRVGALLLAPALAALGAVGGQVESALFGLSGPLGLALAACLMINLWPALARDRA